MTTISMMTLSIKGSFVTPSIKDTSIMTFSITTFCHNAEFRYADCCNTLQYFMLHVTAVNLKLNVNGFETGPLDLYCTTATAVPYIKNL